MTFTDLFSRNSAGYLSHRPSYPSSLFAWLRSLSPNPQAVCWDVGAGTGQSSRALGSVFSRVHASEPSALMLASAKSVDETPACVTYSLAAAEDPLSRHNITSGSVDVISVAQALHWFDRPAFYMRVREASRSTSEASLRLTLRVAP